MQSLRSFITLSGHAHSSSHLWFRSSHERKKGGTGSESALVMDSRSSGHWHKLGKMDEGDLVAHNVVDIERGRTAEEDLEAGAQGRGPVGLNIAVKRGFGTEV